MCVLRLTTALNRQQCGVKKKIYRPPSSSQAAQRNEEPAAEGAYQC